jgi:ParB family chromosome partitioning protein
LQPIAVKAMPDGKYQIVAGERRWRAARMALQAAALQAAASQAAASQAGTTCQRKGYDLKRIPVFIRNPESPTDKLEMQMVENLARADMSDMDIGRALQKLLNATGISKAELARRLGRSDTWVKSVLAKASPEALEVATRIGVDPDSIGAGESLRLISWAKDLEKGAVLDAIAAEIAGGRPYSRALLDDAEDRYEICRRFPKMAVRTDLTLDDLRTWQKMWNSSDPAQRAVADRVLNGATLAEAMQGPAVEPVEAPFEEEMDAGFEDETGVAPGNGAAEPTEAPVPPLMGHKDFDEFEIGDTEAEDAMAARAVLSGVALPGATPLQGATPLPTPQAVSPEERRSVDAAGLSMESGRGYAPVADIVNPDITVRVPGDTVKRILQKAGVPDDLTVDQETLLRAINSLL